jgi:hypothetical protein
MIMKGLSEFNARLADNNTICNNSTVHIFTNKRWYASRITIRVINDK